jgi:hypothetical protein
MMMMMMMMKIEKQVNLPVKIKKIVRPHEKRLARPFWSLRIDCKSYVGMKSASANPRPFPALAGIQIRSSLRKWRCGTLDGLTPTYP